MKRVLKTVCVSMFIASTGIINAAHDLKLVPLVNPVIKTEHCSNVNLKRNSFQGFLNNKILIEKN